MALGDAVCAFNPVYGQGMTTSAMGAATLARCLREQRQRSNGDLAGLARRYQRRLYWVNLTPWLLATGEDFRYPETEGGTPSALTRFLHRYLDQVMLMANDDREASRPSGA